MSSGPGSRTSTNWLFAVLAALCALAFLGGTAQQAKATWIAPLALSTVGLSALDPQVAVDAKGDVTVAWVSGTSNRAIVVAEHPVGGQWTPPVERISATEKCHDPKLDVNPAGAAILVADCDVGPTLRSASRTTGGTWANSVEIPGSASGAEPRVALDDAGNAVVVWSGGGTTVQSSYRPAGGGWNSAVQLSSKTAFEPNVATSPAGYAHAIWREKREESGSDPVVEVKEARKQGAAAWGAPFRLTVNFGSGSTTPVAEGEPQIEVNGASERMMSWLQAGTHQSMSERTSAGDLDGLSDPPRSISEATAHVEALRIGLDGGGRGVAVWRNFNTGEGAFRLRVATTTSLGGVWSSPEPLAGPAGIGPGTEPDLAVTPSGGATLVWREGAATKATSRPAGGAFAPATTISDIVNTDFGEPQVATDPAGNTIVTWSANDPSATHIAVAVNDVTAPAISATPPAPVVVGSAVGLSAVATDTWSATSLSWSFGDGASATGSSVSHAYATTGTKTATVTATDSAGNSASVSIPVTVTSPPVVGPPGGKRHRVIVTAKVAKQTWQKVETAKAIKLSCKLDVAGTCAAKASVGAGVAKRIGLNVAKGQKEVAIGKGFVQAKAGRIAVVKVKLTAKALAAIAAATQPVAVKIAVTGSAAGSDPGSLNRSLKISRP